MLCIYIYTIHMVPPALLLIFGAFHSAFINSILCIKIPGGLAAEDVIEFRCYDGSTRYDGVCGRQCQGGRLENTAPRFLGGKRARLALDMLTISDLWHTEVFYTNLNHSEAPVQQRFCCRYFLLVEMFLVHFDSLSWVIITVSRVTNIFWDDRNPPRSTKNVCQ